MEKNNLLPVIVIVAILAVGGLLVVNARRQPTTSTTTTTTTETESTVTPVQSESMMLETTNSMGNVKSFTVLGTPFAYDVKEIRVKEGDTVEIVFKNQEGFHDWVLDEFNAKTKQIPAGQSETIKFVASKKGTFEYYCSVGTHRQQGMVGNLIVE